jgi:hypothetical protein
VLCAIRRKNGEIRSATETNERTRKERVMSDFKANPHDWDLTYALKTSESLPFEIPNFEAERKQRAAIRFDVLSKSLDVLETYENREKKLKWIDEMIRRIDQSPDLYPDQYEILRARTTKMFNELHPEIGWKTASEIVAKFLGTSEHE